ncbi:MAG: hypothetical protein GQF41_3240 [Candidatus Rifleibacterium amylolyticum]|nr:MAG: hypothetical protein GQF41_3240 [Candidatus Rifleibacterium amylolyticum]
MTARQSRSTQHLVTIMFLFCSCFLQAATLQVPEWFKLTARLDRAPELNQTCELQADIESVIGNLHDVQIKLILPESWKAEPESAKIALIKAGSKHKTVFKVTPGSYLSPGSIVVEAAFIVPKTELIAYFNREMPEDAAELSETVRRWPDETRRYTDISFALTPEETFYPVADDMWLSYDDRITVQEGFRGPSYYEDPLITAHQAQTDVAMFEKLETYIKSDPTLLETMQKSGIDVNRKLYDKLNGLYVLAVKAYQDNSLAIAGNFIEQFESAINTEPATAFAGLRIAAGNIKGLIYWGKGQRRLAEDTFKKTFYSNRKHPLQRYILRNIGLLMLSGKDTATAAEMFRLARSIKQGYTLLDRESEMLGKNR